MGVDVMWPLLSSNVLLANWLILAVPLLILSLFAIFPKRARL